MKSKKTKLCLFLLAIVLIIAGIVWYNSSLSGYFDVSASFPSNEMLAHIVQHQDELLAADERFVANVELGYPGLYFTSDDLFCQFSIHEGAVETLLDPQSVPMSPPSGIFFRQETSEFMDIPLPWNPCSVSISVIYDNFGMMVMAEGLDKPSDAPMVQMMSIIEGIIGKP